MSKRPKSDCSSSQNSSSHSLPNVLEWDPDPEYSPTSSEPPRNLIPKLFSVPNFLKFHRRQKFTTIHRALLISEILSLILDFVRRFDESSDHETKWDRTSGKRTLAALARTCKALSAPALDVLWMRLDNLDPLIRVLPKRMWGRKHYPLVVRLFMGDKQWATFRKYADRVRYLRGPCWRISASVQNNVIDALVRHQGSDLPLLPNLTELVWSELKMSNLIDPSVSLIKHFGGSSITSVSLFLICWPNHVSSEVEVLADLPNLCPNVTSFTAFFPRSSYNDHSKEIGEIVERWPHLQILRSCALSQPVMDTLMANQKLHTLSIELNNSSTATYSGDLPPHVHTWSLGGNSAALCRRYLATIQGSPLNFHLRIGADDSTTADMEDLVGMLPSQLNKDHLCTLTIELTSSYWSTPASDSFVLSPNLLSTIGSFSGLRDLDVSTFSSAEMDDAAYGNWVAGLTGLTGLTSLKVGVGDVSKAKPRASVGAVLAVLRACRQLETLWMVFDASLPLPSRADDKETRAGGTKRGAGAGEKAMKMVRYDNEWGVRNNLLTQLRVGYSPIGEDHAALEALAKCLVTVMPRLEKIRADRYPTEVDERWGKVQELLVRK